MGKKKSSLTIQARRRLFFLRPICLLLVLLVVASVISKLVSLYQLGNEKAIKEKEYIELQEESEILRNQILKFQDPEELAKFARENYYYSKDGELIIKLEDGTEQLVIPNEDGKRENIEIIFLCGLGFALVIIYAIIKSIIVRKKSLSA